MGAAAAGAGASSCLCTTSRGPIMESMARDAMALPVPIAIPVDENARVRTHTGLRAHDVETRAADVKAGKATADVPTQAEVC